jgi:RNA polymerase sigma-70 factor (ECF subfamily)
MQAGGHQVLRAIGTIKSRLNRARHRLAELLGYTARDLSADGITQSVLRN